MSELDVRTRLGDPFMIDHLLRSLVELLARARRALQAHSSPPVSSSQMLLTELAAAEKSLAMGALPWPIVVHVGVIEHNFGTTIYIAQDSKSLSAQLASFCRDYWSEIGDAEDVGQLDDEATITTYFERHHRDTMTREPITLEPSVNVWATDSLHHLERGRYCVLSTAHITMSTVNLISHWSYWPPSSRPMDIAGSVHGWFVPTRRPESPFAEQLPEDLAALMAFGRDGGFDYVLLDCDGDTADDLKVHDW